MKNTAIKLLLPLLAIAAGWLVTATPCQAQEQFRAETWNRPSANAGLRFGTDSLSIGIGAQGGYTLDMGVYIGGDFDYFFGDSNLSAWTLMLEGGYDFGVVENLVVRPLLGLGVVGASVEFCGFNNTCSSVSDTDVEVSLGGQVLYFLGDFNVGGELKVILAGVDAFILGANAGYAF